ncbi:MAG TPA: ABC transporter ATP-binding protein, partial [Rhizobiaceae bacterium]|nr:ABC transporter ATP-binding protein [Rhizobiaceae bacterium]
MRTELKRLHQRMGATIVYVTHDQIEAMTLATKIAVLKDGYLQQFGTPREIYNQPANIFVADFMGSPSMNLIPARIEEWDGALAIAMKTSSGEIRIAAPTRIGALKARAGGEVIFGIRPEALTDPEGADHTGKQVEKADCLIDVLEPAGSDTFAITQLGGKEVIARMRADASVEPGQIVPLAFNLDKAVFFDPATEQRLV